MFRIWEHFKTFKDYCRYKDLKDHMDSVRPLIKVGEDMLIQYRSDNEEAKLIIRRFDEVLLEKASKFSVESLNTKFNNYSEK